MKTLILILALIIISTAFLINATNNYQQKVPVTTGWIFNDTGNCDVSTVS